MALLDFDAKKNPAKAYASMRAAALLVVFLLCRAVRQFVGAHHRHGLLYIMLALGLNIVVGFAGLLDLGYIAFYAVGAYLTACWRRPSSPPARIRGEPVPVLGESLVRLWGRKSAKTASTCRSGPSCPWPPPWRDFGRPAGRADAEAARRLSGHRDPGLRRDHPHLHEQPERADQLHNGPRHQIDPIRMFGVNLAGEAGSAPSWWAAIPCRR
jgi:branched-chain amino acid transport system permease protein